MAEILFFIAGIVLLVKKQVKISSSRILVGKPVKILGLLYISPFIIGFVWGFFAAMLSLNPFSVGFFIEYGLLIIAIIATIYIIAIYKPTENPVPEPPKL